jgi:hypothetical protein
MRHEIQTKGASSSIGCPSQCGTACTPELYAGRDKTGILFVRRHEDIECPHRRSRSYGEFCVSLERIEAYLRQGMGRLCTT